MQAIFPIKPVPIWEFLNKISKALKEALPERSIQDFNITTPILSDSIKVQKPGKDLCQHEGLKEKINIWKTRSFLEATQIDVTFQQNWSVRYVSDQDKRGPALRVDINDSYRDSNLELALVESLNKHFTFIPRTEVAAGAMPDAQLASFRFAEKIVGTLAAETAKISQSTVVAFEDFVLAVKQRTLELETEFQRKSSELEERSRQKDEQLQADFAAKLKNLESREKAHAELVKQFELRNNTAVRRDLLKEIRSKIEEQKTIQISQGTIQKRRIIHLVCAATLLLSSVLMAFFAYKLFNASPVEWKLLVPLSSSTLVFVMTGIYYIKWNDQWFRDHARVEFETRKFSADILRASWIAELFFEWAEKKGVNMPPELVESFTKNLFDTTASDGRLHPTDQLNDLFKQVSTLELNKGGIKMIRKEEKH